MAAEMGADRQSIQLNSASALSVGPCCCWKEKRDTESTEEERPDRKKLWRVKEKEGRASASKNRERRALQNSTAKTEVNCDENGCSHDHNSG